MLDDHAMNDLGIVRTAYKFPANAPRDVVLRIRLTEHEHGRIASRAEAIGVPVATLARAFVLALAPAPE